ncbi:MAG: hypothetical protein QXJ93_02455 [Candidatus Rehaiarchaeum fermentans]|nr:hypothetical protein [Candidatus Rehaiarchaeum fermentans]
MSKKEVSLKDEAEENISSSNFLSFIGLVKHTVDVLTYNAQKSASEINVSKLEKSLNNTTNSKKKNNSPNDNPEINLALYNSYLKSLNWIGNLLKNFPGYEEVKFNLINYEELNSTNYKRVKNSIKESRKNLLDLENKIGKLVSSTRDFPLEDDTLDKILKESLVVSYLVELIKLESYSQDIKSSKKDIVSNLKELDDRLSKINILYAYYSGLTNGSYDYKHLLIPTITKNINKDYLSNLTHEIDEFMNKFFEQIGRNISSNYSRSSNSYM